MSPETQEFGAIYNEIVNEFSGDPLIQVTPVTGDPPSQYEVVYNLPSAVSDEQGEIAIAERHVITISIPFGFPHFSPSCKPKSPVFHPDFDAAAICLGNYWNRERRLPELIRHIAKMLRGELYSTENAFNEEAVAWFQEHVKDLPFSAVPVSEVQSEQVLSLEPNDTGSEELDVLEEDDFLDNLDFADDESLDLEDDLPPALTPEIPESIDEPGLDFAGMLILASSKKFHQLRDELNVLSPTADFPEREELESSTATALSSADEFYSIAEDFEDSGNSQQALETFRQVRDLVSDYPGIDDAISRTEQSDVLLGEMNDSLADAPDPSQAFGEDFDFQQPNAFSPPEPPTEEAEVKEEKEQAPQFFEEPSKRSFNIVPLVAVGAVLCILVTLTYYYFSLTSRLTEAKQLFSECTSHFAGKQFHNAEKSCGAALGVTKSIFLVHQAEVDELQLNIQNILDSEELRQGLLGNVLYNGRYVPLSLLEAHQSFFEARTQGDEFFQSSALDKAISSYQNAINIARRTRDIPPADMLEIEQNIKTAKFRIQLDSVEKLLASDAWEEAIPLLQNLEAALEVLDPAVQSEHRETLQNMRARVQFAQLKLQADRLFSESDWEGAYAMFQRAIEAGRVLSETELQELDDLQQNVVKAELYSKIKSGNYAFASGEWDLAIQEYQNAKSVLNSNASLLKLADRDQSLRKIDRIILQSAILRDSQSAERLKEDDDIDEALKKLQEIKLHIATSGFSDDPEFLKILAETEQAQAALHDKAFIGERVQYLLKNYAELFIENYPAAAPNTLSSPKAEFLRMVGNRYLFKVECTETGRGRPLKLIMFYTYNPATDRWQFYSENQ